MDFLLTNNSEDALPEMALPSITHSKIHVYTHQMGRKWITTIAGLDDDLDLKRIARAMKGDFHCSAKVDTDEKTGGEYIKLSGNQKEHLRPWLIAACILTEKEATDRLVFHGS
jgi:translation initiation factor SUI1